MSTLLANLNTEQLQAVSLPPQHALILAGAGGVGHLAVQFASAYGAEVVTTASRDNHSFLHGLGASQMVDYHDADWPSQVVAAGGVEVEVQHRSSILNT